MGELKDRADSLVRNFNEVVKVLGEQKDKLAGLTGELKSVADQAERISEENGKLAEENKKLQAEILSAKK